MIVSELIELLKTLPQDVKVAAMNTTNELDVVLKGGVVLEEAAIVGPYDSEKSKECGIDGMTHTGPYVTIVGGTWTHYGFID